MKVQILYSADGIPCVPEEQFSRVLKAMKDLVLMQKMALKTHNGDMISQCRAREQNLIAFVNGYEYAKQKAKQVTSNE